MARWPWLSDCPGKKTSLHRPCIFASCLKLRPESEMTHPRSLSKAGSDLTPGAPTPCLPLPSADLPSLEKRSLLGCAVSQGRDGIEEVGSMTHLQPPPAATWRVAVRRATERSEGTIGQGDGRSASCPLAVRAAGAVSPTRFSPSAPLEITSSATQEVDLGRGAAQGRAGDGETGHPAPTALKQLRYQGPATLVGSQDTPKDRQEPQRAFADGSFVYQC